MASGVPLTARSLAHTQQGDLQRVANPRLEVNERRLRPIYDCMEAQNYRRALTEIDRLLKKQPNFTACKALKCLVLVKLERQDEAEILAKELENLALTTQRSTPIGDASNMDENALTFFSQYYKDLRQFDKVVGLYEAASKRDASSEEMLCSLFMAYARMKDYKNQVITAQKLYKLTRKTAYYNWAVISVLLQIDENSENQLKNTLYIPMALRMLEKEFFDDEKNYGEIECLLYLHTLELKGDFNKALDFLKKHLEGLTKSPSNESMLPVYFAHEKQLIYNYKCNQLETTYSLAKEFLTKDNYVWNWFEVLLDTFFKFDSDKRQEFLPDLEEFLSRTEVEPRNFQLARLELGVRCRLTNSKICEKYFSRFYLDELFSYVSTFVGRTNNLLLFDICRPVECLSEEERLEFHRFLIENLGKAIEEENVSKIVNFIDCARICSEVHRQWLIDDDRKTISKLLELSGKNSINDEKSVDLVLLVSTMLEELGENKIDILALLDRVYERDPSNFDLKLYLYKLTLHFNCVPVIKELFDRLEIKNIQFYSLGYLLTDHYLRIHSNYRNGRAFLQYLTNLLQVYTDDSWSQIMFCYKYGNFLRINEIRTFSDCYLSYSLIYLQSAVGSTVINLILNGNRFQSIGQILKSEENSSMFFYLTKNEFSKIQDTRDFDIWQKIDYRRNRFDSKENDQTRKEISLDYADRIISESTVSTNYKSPSYKDSFLRQNQKKDFQQKTNLTFLRLSILKLIQTISGENSIPLINEEIRQSLTKTLEQFDQHYRSIEIVDFLTNSENSTIVELKLVEIIPVFVRILLDDFKPNDSTSNVELNFSSIEEKFKSIFDQLEKSFQIFKKRIVEHRPEKKINDEFLLDFAGKNSSLEYFSIYLEFISYVFSFFLIVRSIFAFHFKKSSLLNELNENSAVRPSNSKKNKKKSVEQQTKSSSTNDENFQETNLWNQFEKIERIFDEQWSQIIKNIHEYESIFRQENLLKNEDFQRLERQIDFENSNLTSNAAKNKNKNDENQTKNEIGSFAVETNSTTKNPREKLELKGNSLRPSTIREFALGYLESLIQIRVALSQKQKSLRLHQNKV